MAAVATNNAHAFSHESPQGLSFHLYTMIFSISVLSAPYSSQEALAAYKFAQATLLAGHSIKRIFFHGDGVLNASCLTTAPQDEINLHQAWVTLAETHHVELIVCIASALRRGIIDQSEASRYQKAAFSLQTPFVLSGLGQLVEAVMESDRFISFGD